MRLVGLAVLAVLGLFAWRYYLERVACFDSAFFSWLMIDEQAPVSVLGRIGSWLAQLLPVAVMRLGAPLEWVLRTYSVSFIVLHVLVFLWVALGMRDRRATIALPIALTAGFHYMFYYGISELYQGLVLSLPLWVLIRRTIHASTARRAWPWAIAAVALNVWISLYHQLLLFPLVFMLGLELLQYGHWRRARVWALAAVLVLWYVVRIKLLTASAYEGSRLLSAQDVLAHIGQLGELASTQYLQTVWTKFKAFHLMALLVVGLAVARRAWWTLAWTVLFSAGFLVLALIVDRDMWSPIICENYYPVVAFFWAVVFADLVAPLRGWRGIEPASAGMAVICALGLLQIHRGHYRLSEKVAYSQRLAGFHAAHGEHRVVVHRAHYPWRYTLGHWAEGFTSALATAVQGPTHAATLFVPEEGAVIDTLMAQPLRFLGPSWEPAWFEVHNLQQRYFAFPREKGYSWANTMDPTFDHGALQLTPPATPFRLVPDRYTVVPLVIHNPTDRRMPSRDTLDMPLRFHYTLTAADGTTYPGGDNFTAMETDIPAGATYTQGIVIERPPRTGSYVVDLWCPGTPLRARFQVVADRWPL